MRGWTVRGRLGGPVHGRTFTLSDSDGRPVIFSTQGEAHEAAVLTRQLLQRLRPGERVEFRPVYWHGRRAIRRDDAGHALTFGGRDLQT